MSHMWTRPSERFIAIYIWFFYGGCEAILLPILILTFAHLSILIILSSSSSSWASDVCCWVIKFHDRLLIDTHRHGQSLVINDHDRIMTTNWENCYPFAKWCTSKSKSGFIWFLSGISWSKWRLFSSYPTFYTMDWNDSNFTHNLSSH